MSTEHLLNIREAAEYLGVGEKIVRDMVDAGALPAYKIGGSFLRFKKSQLVLSKAAITKNVSGEVARQRTQGSAVKTYGLSDALRDFLYFNDFYIISAIVIAIAVLLMIVT